MIRWTNDIANDFKISTTDNRKVASGTTPYFAMEVKNDMTKVVKFFYCTLTTIRPRFVQLRVGEPGTVNLVEQGFYTYRIWETDDNTYTLSNYEANLTDDDLVHRGKLYFDDLANDEVTYTQYTPTSNDNTTNSNTVYLTI